MAISRVQGNARGISNTTTLTVTLDSTPTSGNKLIASIGGWAWSGTTPTVSSISQTNVSWEKAISVVRPTNYCDAEVWLGAVSASASTTVTITLSAAGQGIADICEYSGLADTPIDKTASAYGNSAGSLTSTGATATTTQADELWVGSIEFCSGTQSTPTNSFTLLDGADANSTSLVFLEKIVSSTGTANSGTTGSTAWNGWAGCIATFKAAADLPSRISTSRNLMGVGW